MSASRVLEADLTWTDRGFEEGVQVEVRADGRIGAVGRVTSGPVERLARRALLPGFVNAHSHAFQRGLRGQGERFPAGAGSFWTWRQAMYRLVEGLDPERFLELTRQAFREMRRAGITTVGEFHYLHHHTPGDFAFDRLLTRAAADTGIRLSLLSTYYRTGGIGKPLDSAQKRFETKSPEAYWGAFDALAGENASPLVTHGAVVHSVRAATLDELGAIHAGAVSRHLVFHIHVEEQRQEVADCQAAFGMTPMQALLQAVDTTSNVTAVHCTHTSEEDRRDFVERGGRICVCPTTEGNLGDGLPVLDAVPFEQLCLGTDSNARIDMAEEARWLEYGQRLRGEARGLVRDARGRSAHALFHAATVGGARALGLDTGRIATGGWADFQLLELDHPTLAGATPDTLLDAWLFGSSAGAVAATMVGGQW